MADTNGVETKKDEGRETKGAALLVHTKDTGEKVFENSTSPLA